MSGVGLELEAQLLDLDTLRAWMPKIGWIDLNWFELIWISLIKLIKKNKLSLNYEVLC